MVEILVRAHTSSIITVRGVVKQLPARLYPNELKTCLYEEEEWNKGA